MNPKEQTYWSKRINTIQVHININKEMINKKMEEVLPAEDYALIESIKEVERGLEILKTAFLSSMRKIGLLKSSSYINPVTSIDSFFRDQIKVEKSKLFQASKNHMLDELFRGNAPTDEQIENLYKLSYELIENEVK